MHAESHDPPPIVLEPMGASPAASAIAPWLWSALASWRVIVPLLLALAGGLFFVGSASADTVTTSGDQTVEVGEPATIVFTINEDGQEPDICSQNERAEYVFTTGNFYDNCPISGYSFDFGVDTTSPGQTSITFVRVNFFTAEDGVYRSVEINQTVTVTVLAKPVVSVTGVAEGGVYTDGSVTPGCAVDNLRDGTTIPMPVITGDAGPFPRTVTANCTFEPGTSLESIASVTYTVTSATSRPGRVDRPDRIDRPAPSDRPDRSVRPDRPDRPPR